MKPVNIAADLLHINLSGKLKKNNPMMWCYNIFLSSRCCLVIFPHYTTVSTYIRQCKLDYSHAFLTFAFTHRSQ